MNPYEKDRDELIEEYVTRMFEDICDVLKPYLIYFFSLASAFCLAFFLVKCGVFK
jgi:uncharacterized membrane protein YwaF